MKTEWTNEPKKLDLNPSEEKLREMIAEKDAEIARLKTTDWVGATETLTKRLIEKDAERYRKLKPLFHKSIIMANGRRWWDCHIATDPEIETLDAAVDALPEVQS